jgi:cardiolipin synthase
MLRTATHIPCYSNRSDTDLNHARRKTLGRRQLATLAASGLLARCATVPDVNGLSAHDIGLAGRSAKPIPIWDAVDDPVALQHQYDLQNALSANPLVFGNQVTLLPSGSEAFRAIFKAIAGARDSINLEYFILADVVSDGVTLSSVLLDRLRAGVKVNMIYDSFGSKDTPAVFFEALRQAGAKVVQFNPVDPLATWPFSLRVGWSPNDRDHRKIAIVDGRIGFAGGVNLDKAYETPPSAGIPADGDTRHAFWCDEAIRIEGPVVANLQKLFFVTWRAQKAPAADPANYFPALKRQGVQTMRIIGSSPSSDKPLYYASLLTAMRSARRRVGRCSGYFVPPHQDREDLAKIARSGVDVRIIVPAFSDVESAVYASRAAYGDLLEAGVHIYEVTDAVVHAKLAVVDDTWTMIGSSNLDRRSVVFNNEVDAVIVGRETANQVEALMRRYITAASEIDLAAWKARSLNERLEEIQARIWEYWM